MNKKFKSGKSMPQASGSMSLSGMMEAANLVASNILAIEVDKLISNEQVRKEFDDLEELAESLKVEGQQSAIIVSPADPVTGQYTIQKGERRWRAAKLAGLKKVHIVVVPKPKSQSESVAGQLVENIQRKDLKPMELASALGLLHAEGLSYQDIATRLGKSKRWVQMYMNLELAPDYIQDLCISKITQDMEVISILRTLHDIDETECRALCEKAHNEGAVTRQQCRSKLEQVKEEKESRDKPGAGATPAEPARVVPDTESASQTEYEIDEETGEAQALMPLSGMDGAAQGRTEESDAFDSDGDDSQPAKPENKRARTEGLSATDHGAPDEWVELDTADAMKIEVDVLIDGSQAPGYLMTDRVSPAPSFAWVYLYEDGYSLCTHVTNIAITGVKTH